MFSKMKDILKKKKNAAIFWECFYLSCIKTYTSITKILLRTIWMYFKYVLISWKLNHASIVWRNKFPFDLSPTPLKNQIFFINSSLETRAPPFNSINIRSFIRNHVQIEWAPRKVYSKFEEAMKFRRMTVFSRFSVIGQIPTASFRRGDFFIFMNPEGEQRTRNIALGHFSNYSKSNLI